MNCPKFALIFHKNASTWHELVDLPFCRQSINWHDLSQDGHKLVTDDWHDELPTFITRESLLKKHAIEYTKLMKEYEGIKAKGREDMKLASAQKEAEFEKESQWKEMIEQIIFILAKEMTGS